MCLISTYDTRKHNEQTEGTAYQQMNRWKSRLKRHRSAMLTGLMQILLFLGQMYLFFGLMSITNWPLRNLSRTLGTTLVTYIAMSLAMNAVYGGFDVGRRKNKPLISALCLSTLVTDLVTYLQLQIMNVNENNNDTLRLFGPDFVWLLISLAAQAIFIILMVNWANGLYFKMNPPRKVLMVLGDESRREILQRKIGRYSQQWKVEDAILWHDSNLHQRVRHAQVVFLDSEIPNQTRFELLKFCYACHRDIICKAKLQDIMLASSRQVIIDDAPCLEMDFRKMTLWQRIIKRLTDIGSSFLALVVLSPLMLLVALAIHLEDRGPVFFRQKRLTVGGRTFTILKFRTMSQQASASHTQVSATAGDQRITKVGAWLRRFRLDELPQLWNILVGDMTLVGPRPEMLENIEKYKAELPAFAYREKMKAGLTGYAQIEGRYNTTPEDKLMMDLMYIENFSLWEDVKLIMRTMTVFFKKDSTQGFSAPREEDKPAKDLSA